MKSVHPAFTRRLSSCAVLLLLAAACSAKSTRESSLPPAQDVRVTVSPDTATLYETQSVEFAAAVTGTSNSGVTWSVTGGDANGTVTASGVYTAPATTGTFTVVAASVAAPGVTGSAQVTVLAMPPDGVPMTTAHRTSGVAPLSVFFDAVDTNTPSDPLSPFVWSSGVYQPTDYEATFYEWDFGDPGSGTWGTTGNTRNKAVGYTAAHVFETPGTYKVTLRITDTGGTVRTYTETITVTAFSGTTYYVASSGNDTNTGTAEASPVRTVDRAMTLALSASGPVRVLMRRGDTFSTSGQWNITKPGPGIIGAYGTGAKPVINVGYTGDLNVFSPQGAGNDWRIMDLSMVGPGSGYPGPAGPPVGVTAVDTLMLRLTMPSGWDVGLGWGEYNLGAHPHDAQFVVECEAATAYRNGMYVGGRRLVMMGNNIHNTTISHLLRVWQAHKAVISNNRLFDPGGSRSALKLHSTDRQNPRPETRWVSVTENLFKGTTWAVAVGLQGGPEDERPSHVLIERNRFYGESTITAHLMIHSSEVMVRNNLFNATGSASECSGVWITHESPVPIENHVRVYNNTMVRTDASTTFVPVEIDSGITNVIVRNNLGAHAAVTTEAAVDTTGLVSGRSGGAGTGFAQSNNVFVALSQLTNATGGDFSLASTATTAVDKGVNLAAEGVIQDLLGTARPVGAGWDIGAFESH